jgi:acyl carrier protein
LKTAEAASAVLAPKAKGALVLASLLEGTPLDFFALFSSIASVAGGFGQADACAANAFLDAFAQQRSAARGGGRTVAVNWSAFQWDEWQAPPSAALPGLQEQIQENLLRNGISAGESMECFERALGDALPQVVVCPQDLGATVAQTDAFTVASFLDEVRRARPAEAHPRPALGVAYVEPRDETERTIAALWQEAFGIERVGVEDNFFDLAGNSLLAIQLVTRLRQAFGVELPMTSLFDAPTVAALALKVGEPHDAQSEQAEMERLLAEIEGLSLDEAERNLAEELGAGE